MPTAAKLVGAVCLALSGLFVIWVTLEVYPTLLRRQTALYGAVGVVGLLIGWFRLGLLVLEDEGSGVKSGARAALSMVLWALGLFGFDVMISGILRHSYFDPMSALLQIPNHVIVFGKMGLALPISGSIVILAIVSGVVTKRASDRWL